MLLGDKHYGRYLFKNWKEFLSAAQDLVSVSSYLNSVG
jgi:hypothetical protein